jgi:hypothetical protein
MAGDDVQQKARLRAAILRHVRRNAFSADTAKGILACWLPETDFEDAASHIDPVLEELVAERWLISTPLPGGDILYSANLEKCSTSPSSSSPQN